MSWFEDDAFWAACEGFLFDDEKLEAAEREVEQACALLGVSAGAALLDLCCGPGRHSLALAARGFVVTGVDRTARYLERARAEAARRGIDARLELVEQDMREFRREQAFDGAINLFTSFGYFADEADDLRVAENLRCSLRPGARLVIETTSKELLARDFTERTWQERDGDLLLEHRSVSDSFSRAQSRWLLVTASGQRLENRLDLRIYAASELVALLREAGFSSVRCFGDLAGAPFDHDARRLVALAEA